VPRIEDELLDSVIFLYPSEDHARMGTKNGGSGFLVGQPSGRYADMVHLYAVTNSHVINGGCPIVRLNTHNGRMDILSLSHGAWQSHDDADVAVCPVELVPSHYKYGYVPRASFITEDEVRAGPRYGPGDDVFFLGRYTDHHGAQRNLPTARFGHLAMLPGEPVLTQGMGFQESFLVDAWSLKGYSGSPVFVYRMAYGARLRAPQGVSKPRLLGIDWGQIPRYEEVVDKQGYPHPDGWRAQQNAGMMGVVPAWKLAELLDGEELVARRKAREDELGPPKAVGVLNTEDEPDFTKEDFEAALRKASRRIKPSPPDEGTSGT
jgi:hypothetical protein